MMNSRPLNELSLEELTALSAKYDQTIADIEAEHPDIALKRLKEREAARLEEEGERRRFTSMARALREEADRKTVAQQRAADRESRKQAAVNDALAFLNGPRVIERDEGGRVIRMRPVKRIITNDEGVMIGHEDYDE